jgi:hypothetical protein
MAGNEAIRHGDFNAPLDRLLIGSLRSEPTDGLPSALCFRATGLLRADHPIQADTAAFPASRPYGVPSGLAGSHRQSERWPVVRFDSEQRMTGSLSNITYDPAVRERNVACLLAPSKENAS